MRKFILIAVAVMMLLAVPAVASAEYELNVTDSGMVYRIDSNTGACWYLLIANIDGFTYYYWQMIVERDVVDDAREKVSQPSQDKSLQPSQDK